MSEFFDPMVWHFNPIVLINYLHIQTNYKNWAHSAFGYLLAQVESRGDYSAYNKTINDNVITSYSIHYTKLYENS